MAEPTTFELTTNPCAVCAGHRDVQFMSWREPGYWVTCRHCGRYATSATDQTDAVAAWDADNAPRSVDAGDALDAEISLLQPKLSPHVLDVLASAADVFSRSGETQDLATFLAWCVTVS